MAAPKTPTRPYAIRTKPAGEIVAIVRAGSPAAALRHHFRSRFAVAVATVDDAFDAQASGLQIVDAGADDDGNEEAA